MSGGVPAGWVLVPEVATPEMTEAYEDCYGFYPDGPPFEFAWATVLSATPTPPIEGRDADVERATTTLDVFLAAYSNLPDESLARPNADDDLMTWGDLRTILAALQALGERG